MLQVSFVFEAHLYISDFVTLPLHMKVYHLYDDKAFDTFRDSHISLISRCKCTAIACSKEA